MEVSLTLHIDDNFTPIYQDMIAIEASSRLTIYRAVQEITANYVKHGPSGAIPPRSKLTIEVLT